MYVHVPAMRGQIGSRTYYSCLMPMSAIPNLFKFTDWTGFTPEDREQRVLNEKRVPDLANYILDNEKDYLFSSITVSYKTEPIFVPNSEGSPIGELRIKLGDEMIINDGQHRCAGIAKALKDGADVGEHNISVLLFPWESKDRVQQMFSDLNRFVVKTSKSLDILYDKRDQVSISTIFALDRVPVFKELTEKEDISLRAKSTKLFTLAAFYDANRDLLKEQKKDSAEENARRLVEYWTEVAMNMPVWDDVLKRHKTAIEVRAGEISAHSTVLRALGALGSDLMKLPDWKEKLKGLRDIDWSKKNPEWENVCIIANSVISNRQARAATAAFIKKKLGLPSRDGEQARLPGKKSWSKQTTLVQPSEVE
jgi:DNA sulfur modification protein DndB